MSTHRSNSFSHARGGYSLPLLEPDTQVMGRDADMYVRKIELEVKKLHNIKRAFNILHKDREDRRDRCKTLQQNLDASIHKVNNVKNASLMKQKSHFLKKHDEIMQKVNNMIKEIETLRRSRMRHIHQINTGMTLIEQKEQDLQKLNQLIAARKDQTMMHQEQMYELNERNTEEKENYKNEFEQIDYLMDQEKRQRDLYKKQQKSKGHDNYLAGTFDTASILKRRLQKIILKNKEKVSIMDTYMRFMNIIDNAFNQIKETTGITDIQEIQNTFIKSEEQNHSLLTYVDLLHQQIDHLEDQTSELDNKIKQQILENEEKRRILNSTPDEVTQVRQLQKKILAKENYIKDFSEILQQIKPNMEKPVAINPSHMNHIEKEDKSFIKKKQLESFAIDHIERKLKNNDMPVQQQKEHEDNETE